MKVFLIRVSVFLLIIYSMDLIVGVAHNYLYPQDYLKIINEKKNVFKYDIDTLIIGDSYAADGFYPDQTKTFNFGLYHSTPFDHYYFLKEFLPKKKIKTLVYNVNTLMFSKKCFCSKFYPEFISSFIYYLSSSNTNDLLKYFSRFYSNPVSFSYMIKKYVTKTKIKQTREILSLHNGYADFMNTMDDFKLISPEIESFKKCQKDYFLKISNLLKENNISLKVTTTPVFLNERAKKSYDIQLNMLSEFLETDISDCPKINLNREDFLNETHLNTSGAIKFTPCIMNLIL